MPLNFSAAHSSRIIKGRSGHSPSLKRSLSSPFAELKRRKPPQRSQSKPELTEEGEDFFEHRLDDVGIIKVLETELSLRDVPQVIQSIRRNMFDDIPENGGFHSTRIAEILNYRRCLPPTVTAAHVHALLPSPTKTEKEIAEMVRAGIIRKSIIPGRGAGRSGIGECLALFSAIETLVRCSTELDESTADSFISRLRDGPAIGVFQPTGFTKRDITALMSAGFITSTSSPTSFANALFSTSDSTRSQQNITTSSVFQAPSGSAAAAGGEGAVSNAGGRDGMRCSCSKSEENSGRDVDHCGSIDEEFFFSMPNTGSFLKLLATSQSHLVSLVAKSKFREMPVYMLKERWDGGISAGNPAAQAKKYRGDFHGVLPSRTRKWKQFYGLSFHWVLAECLGAGTIELFDTGSVGRAVRIP